MCIVKEWVAPAIGEEEIASRSCKERGAPSTSPMAGVTHSLTRFIEAQDLMPSWTQEDLRFWQFGQLRHSDG